MEFSTILVSLASSVVVAVFTYVGVVHRAKAELEMKRLEMRESRRQIVLEEFMRNADIAIRSNTSRHFFYDSFSSALLFMDKKQSDKARAVRKAIEESDTDSAKDLLADLCISLQRK